MSVLRMPVISAARGLPDMIMPAHYRRHSCRFHLVRCLPAI